MLSLSLKRAAVLCSAALLFACSEAAETDAATAKDTASASAAESNWVRTLARTEAGGYLMGNPDAPVKLIEYASLTCSHCADFHETAMAELKGKYIATGEVSYELRNFFLNPADIAATLLARCSTPEAFFALTDAFFERQQSWLEPFTKVEQAQLDRLQTLPPNEAMAEYAELGNLGQFVQARGIPASKVRACLTDQEELNTLDQIRQTGIQEHEVTGTPSFVLDGEPVPFRGWSDLKSKLDDAV